MGVRWLLPSALAGLALVAVPILVHLLARQHGPTRTFPSLRFVTTSSMTALRRRRLDEWVLLACRGVIVAAAALAVAGPVLQRAWRHDAQRLAQAVIVEGPGGAEPSALRDPEAFRSVVLTSARAGDAVGEAVRWFSAQPRASRELVLAGSFRRGAVSAEDLSDLPPDVGIRLIRIDRAAPPREVEVPRLVSRGGRSGVETRVAQLTDDATTVVTGGFEALSELPVRLEAAPDRRSLEEAALQAALVDGLPWREGAGPVTVTLPDTQPEDAPARVSAAVHDAVGAPVFEEPAAMTDAQLAGLSRPMGDPPSSDVLVDEGDRRWMWAAALALLAIEWRLRRARAVSDAPAREVNVA